MKIWYMFDNHTFEWTDDLDRDNIRNCVRQWLAEDSCGTLFVKDEWGQGLNNLTLHTHQIGRGKYGISDADVEVWLDKIEDERSFRTLMA